MRRRPRSIETAVVELCEALKPLWVSLGCAALILVILGLSLLAEGPSGGIKRNLFGLEAGLSLATLATGAVLIAASALSVVASRTRLATRPADPRAAMLLAAATAVLAVDAAGSIHESLEGRFAAVGRVEAVLPPLVAGLGAVFLGAWVTRHSNPALAIWLAGGLAWLGSLSLELGAQGGHSYLRLVDLAAACLFFLALVIALRGRMSTPRIRRRGANVKDTGLQLLRLVPLKAVALTIGLAIIVLVFAGTALGEPADLEALGLRDSLSVPKYFAALLALLGAGLAVACARVEGSRRWRSSSSTAGTAGGRWPWWAIAAILTVLSADELLELHPRLEGFANVDPPELVLLPLIPIAALAWLAVMKRISGHRPAARLWLGGAVAWAVAEMGEVIDRAYWINQAGNERDVPLGAHHVVEEALEMVGSALFLLALLIFLQRVLLAPPAPLPAGPSSGRQRVATEGLPV